MANPKPVLSFREQLAQLEEITTRLEDESVDLDEALVAFERGNELIISLKKQLESAELKVKEISKTALSSKSDKKD